MKTEQTTRRLALVVDSVTGIIEVDAASIVGGEQVVPDLEFVQGVAQLAGDLVLIHNLERCLSLHEARLLRDALVQMAD